jgi:methanogenic corrinoid protein MtbC1
MSSADTSPGGPGVVDLIDALTRNDRVGARAMAERWLDGRRPLSFIEEVAVPALEAIGLRWERGQTSLAQVYTAGRLCETLVGDLLTDDGSERRWLPRVAIAVLCDQHTLGKRVVTLAVRAAGYELIDYGAGLSPEVLATQADADGIDVLLLSVLMLSSALQVERVSRRLASLNASTRLVVGGAPFRLDPSLWKRVGADACGSSASDAVRLIAEVRGAR